MKTATTLSFALLIVFAGQLAHAQRRCCCRIRRSCYVPATRCVVTYRYEPTCGLPAYSHGSVVYQPTGNVVSAPASAPSMPHPAVVASAPQPSAPIQTQVGTPLVETPSTQSQGVPVAVDAIPSPSDGLSGDEIAQSENQEWKSLFDGKSLGDWEITKFGGEGEVAVEDGRIFCDFGQYITGITYKGKDLPTNNYEIELEAQRVDGQDFFCGLTFPIDKTHATFVCGGWGGSVTGISSIDQYDASENDTTDYMEFKNKKWYKIRVRVTEGVLEAWINDKKMVNKEVESSRLSTRIEVDPSKPLGVCCFDTQAAYRNIRIRTVTEPDSKGSSE